MLSYLLNDYHALGMGIDLGMEKKINSYTIGLVLRNIPSSGMIWDNGTIEGTLPQVSIGIHTPFNYLKTKDIAMKGISKILESLCEKYTMGIVTSSRKEHFDIIHKIEDRLIDLGFEYKEVPYYLPIGLTLLNIPTIFFRTTTFKNLLQ